MLRKLVDRLTYANVIATLALFVALGGSGYAATKISGKNIKNKSITGKKLRNRTITGRKLKKNTLGGTEITESKLGKVGNAESADNASHADRADDAGTVDGIDSSTLARRSDGVGFLVPPDGWAAAVSSFSSISHDIAGQATFSKDASASDQRMKLPLSYPTRSNGRPLRLTSIRICRTTTNATIKHYSLDIGSGSSFGSDGRQVSVNASGSGCDVVDVSNINPQGGPFNVAGDVTANFGVAADYTGGGGSITLGAAQLTLVPG